MEVGGDRKIHKGVRGVMPITDLFSDIPQAENVFKSKHPLLVNSGREGDVVFDRDQVFGFNLPVSNNYFTLDGLNLRMITSIRKKGSSEAPRDDTFVAPISGLLDTAFSRATLYSHGQEVITWPHYSLCSYIHTLLNSTRSDYETYLRDLEGYTLDGLSPYLDDSDDLEDGLQTDVSFTGSPLLAWRKQRWGQGAKIELCGTPFVPAFPREKLIPLACNWRLEFNLNSNSYALMQGYNAEDCELVIKSMELFVETFELKNTAQTALEKPLKSRNPFRYSFQDYEVTIFHLNKGSLQFSLPTFVSLAPRQIIVGFLHEQAFVGNKFHNPFNFRKLELKNLNLMFEDENFNFDLNISEGLWKPTYKRILNNVTENPQDAALTSQVWFNSPLYVFDVTPGATSNDVSLVPSDWDRPKPWSLRGEFFQKLNHNVTLFIIREIDKQLQIDSHFNAQIS
jgi:hypothetical protein